MLSQRPAALKIHADHAATTQSQREMELIPPPCHPLRCPAFCQGCAGGGAGMLEPQDAPFPPRSPMQNYAGRHQPESILSPFFLSARRHPTKEGALAFKRFLFARCGLPWIGCIHRLALRLGLLPPWLRIRQNTEREPDINLSRSKEIFSSETSQEQKTSLLLTQSSHSEWLYLTSRQPSAPAGHGDEERGCPTPGNWEPRTAPSSAGETQSFFHQVHRSVSMRGLLRAVKGEKPLMFPVSSAKGKLKTS